MKVFLVLACGALSLCVASGSGGPATGGGGKPGGNTGGGVTAPTSAEVRSLNERVPAGATFQAKFLLTQPRPIGSGGSTMFIGAFDVNGVAISSPLGDAGGAAVWANGFLTVNVASPLGDYGTSLDYPFLLIAMTVPAGTATGFTQPLDFVNAQYAGPAGPITFTDPKPGALTVGGSVAIHNISPGAGVWPAGTVVTVQGSGFTPATKLVAKMRMSPAVYISPSELRFTLLDSSTSMDMLPLTAQNPDGSSATYYAYLRGKPVAPPSRILLQHTDPAFPSLARALATFDFPANSAGQFSALAIQNPGASPAVVTIENRSTGAFRNFTLQFGDRLMDDVAVLLGAPVNAGDPIVVTATAAVQMLGLNCDEGRGTVMPFVPAF